MTQTNAKTQNSETAANDDVGLKFVFDFDEKKGSLNVVNAAEESVKAYNMSLAEQKSFADKRDHFLEQLATQTAEHVNQMYKDDPKRTDSVTVTSKVMHNDTYQTKFNFNKVCRNPQSGEETTVAIQACKPALLARGKGFGSAYKNRIKSLMIVEE